MKRKTMNPVVSPEIDHIGQAEAFLPEAGNRERITNDEIVSPPRGRRRHRATHNDREVARRATRALDRRRLLRSSMLKRP